MGVNHSRACYKVIHLVMKLREVYRHWEAFITMTCDFSSPTAAKYKLSSKANILGETFREQTHKTSMCTGIRYIGAKQDDQFK